MKIAVIGGGSTYTPELVSGFLARADQVPISELCLMDPDPGRLGIVGSFAQRMVEARQHPFDVTLTDSRPEAIAGAAYVITQLRVGMMEARRGDEYLGRRHGLIGQETTGIGGLAKALRTIPVILDVAAEMRKRAPSALLVNFTNPAGLVTEALTRHAPDIASVGLCNSGITTRMSMLAQMEKILGQQIDPVRAELDTLGLNHLTWHRGFTIDGEDMWPRIFNAFLKRVRDAENSVWDAATIEALGMIPNSYLQYFYATQRKIEEQAHWPPSRAEEVMEIENALLRDYADPALTEIPPTLMQRGGAYYSTLAIELINAHHNDLDAVHVVNVPHRGAVPGWDPDWVVEIPARVDRRGIHPQPAAPLPAECFALLSRVKQYELLAVEAAVHGDRGALFEALHTHPLGPDVSEADKVMADLLASNRRWLPRFHR